MKGEQKHDTFIICMQHRISDLRSAGCKRHLHADQLKILVEDEERAKWCHTEGVTKMLWGAGSGILCHVPMQRISGSFMAGGISCTDGGYYHHGI